MFILLSFPNMLRIPTHIELVEFHLNDVSMSRVMKMRSKVFPGMHLAQCLPPVGEINLFGYGKFYRVMSLSAWLSCKDIHKMLKWSSGTLIWISCSRVAMITPLRYLKRIFIFLEKKFPLLMPPVERLLFLCLLFSIKEIMQLMVLFSLDIWLLWFDNKHQTVPGMGG